MPRTKFSGPRDQLMAEPGVAEKLADARRETPEEIRLSKLEHPMSFAFRRCVSTSKDSAPALNSWPSSTKTNDGSRSHLGKGSAA